MSTTNFVAVSDTVRTFVARDFGLFIDGAMQPAHSAARLDVYDPATGERLATVADADAHDVDRAVASAKHALTLMAMSFSVAEADQARTGDSIPSPAECTTPSKGPMDLASFSSQAGIWSPSERSKGSS